MSESTASIARAVISEAGDSTPSADVTTTDHAQALADHHPEAALRELFHLSGGETDRTRLEASALVQRTDPRPVVMTREGLLRRQHDPDASLTSRIARDVMDMGAASGGLDGDPRIQRSKAIHDYVRQVFKEANEQAPPEDLQAIGSEAWHEAADNLLDLMIKTGRENNS